MSARRRPWASPLVQFVVASLLLFGITWWATGIFSQRAARSEALADARGTTELLANSVAEPAMPGVSSTEMPVRSTGSTARCSTGCW